jgi:thioredoxin-like negative regulator of GroEL
MQPVITLNELSKNIESEEALLVYFSHDQCNVCKVLKPKIEALIKSHYPKLRMLYCNTISQPEIAAQHSIFAVPSIIVWFQGKETFRFSRNIGLHEFEIAINRPYKMLFGEER